MKFRIIMILCFSLGATGVRGENLSEMECKESDGSFSRRCGERMKQLDKNIKLYISNASCSYSADCKTAGYGAKLCGGPAEYLAYSRKGDNEKSFLKEVLEYNELSRLSADHISRKLGMVSDCALVNDPGAACVSNRCVLGNSGKMQ